MSEPKAPSASQHNSRIVNASPVYYGWIILAAATFGLMMTTPGQTVAVSVFIDRIIPDLDVSRTTVSLMYTFATLLGSVALPFVGRFVDRRGPRLAVILIASAFAFACVFMGLVNGLVMLFVGFTLIRSLGQGSLSLVSQYVINIWFVRRRGLAIGISGIGIALGFAFFPGLIEMLIGRYDWRVAYMLLGLGVAATILPLGALLYREQPEKYGLEPDGKADPLSKRPKLSEAIFTLNQARRTPTFWLLVSAGVAFSSLGTGLLFHNYDLLAQVGLDRDAATRVFVPLGFMAAAANLVTGYFLDRVAPRFMLSVPLTLLAFLLLFVTILGSSSSALLYGAAFGLMQGMSGAVLSVAYPYYFGRAHLGSIKGFVTTLTVGGTAFGPVIFSLGRDLFGSYQPILLILALIPLGLALSAPFVKPPELSS